MNTQGLARKFGIVTKSLDQAIDGLIKSPLHTGRLVEQLQSAAEALEVALSSINANSSADVIAPLVTAIQRRAHRIQRLLDSAAALSGGLMSTSGGSAHSYGATGAEQVDPAGWRMRLEA